MGLLLKICSVDLHVLVGSYVHMELIDMNKSSISEHLIL